MRVLWVSTSGTFYNPEGITKTNSYNGVGWVASQQLQLINRGICDLAIMFPTSDKNAENRVVDGVAYYPIIDAPSKLSKLIKYYYSHRNDYYQRVSSQVKAALYDFHPDIIHVFGLECPLSAIVSDTNVPCIVHLQGILSAYENVFFPPSFGKQEVKRFGLFQREHIFRNGFLYAYSYIKQGAKYERELFKRFSTFLGRTNWDREITSLYSKPDAKYYHVNEILRPEFYNTVCTETRKEIDCLRIVSTVSATMYKGLDFIFRVADELDYARIPFQWSVIGIEKDSYYQGLISRVMGLKANKSIIFEGIKNAKEIVDILNNSDVYFHPSYIDNSPNSLCEAQILNVPVIATNVGGVSSIVKHNETGLLVTPNDSQMATVYLREIYRNYDLRLRLAQNGMASAIQRHNPQKIIDDIINIYNNLMNDEVS